MSTQCNRIRQQGLTYVEVLVAAVLVALIAWPAADSIRVALLTAQQSIDETAHHFELLALMEQTLAEDFDLLAATAADAMTAVRTEILTGGEIVDIYMAPYDGDNADTDADPFTGGDDGLLWVRVQVRGTRLYYDALASR